MAVIVVNQENQPGGTRDRDSRHQPLAKSQADQDFRLYPRVSEIGALPGRDVQGTPVGMITDRAELVLALVVN